MPVYFSNDWLNAYYDAHAAGQHHACQSSSSRSSDVFDSGEDATDGSYDIEGSSSKVGGSNEAGRDNRQGQAGAPKSGASTADYR